MQFAQPIFLWALAGLSIPLAIHLLSRKEGKVIKMGSLRHLRETSTQQFRGIKLNEILLLTLRSLLIALFVFLISGLYWKGADKKWLLVEKDVEKNTSAKKLADSLLAKRYEWHWLQKDFPLRNVKPAAGFVEYWELMQSLQQKEIQSVIVLSTSKVENFKGIRQSINGNIQWITFPTESTDFIAEVIRQTPEQLLIRQGHSQTDYTSFETVRSTTPLPDSIQVNPIASIKIAIVFDPKYEQEKKIITAALMATNKIIPIDIKIIESSPEKIINSYDWVLWLSSNAAVTNDSMKIITYQIQPFHKLIERSGKNKWTITKRLNLDNARESHLTLQLASLLINEKEKWNKVSLYDRRALPDSVLLKGSLSNSKNKSATLLLPINKWLLVAFLLILFIERFIAYQRNQ
jgi:hypothetical protein